LKDSGELLVSTEDGIQLWNHHTGELTAKLSDYGIAGKVKELWSVRVKAAFKKTTNQALPHDGLDQRLPPVLFKRRALTAPEKKSIFEADSYLQDDDLRVIDREGNELEIPNSLPQTNNWYVTCPLVLAIEMHIYSVASSLLKCQDLDVNTVNASGESALILASRDNVSDLVTSLLARKADVGNTTREGEETALWLAVYNRHYEVARELLASCTWDADRIALVNQADSLGVSPLYVSVALGYPELTLLLVSNNADVNQSNKADESPLWVAAARGRLDMVSFLLKHNAVPTATNSKGKLK